MPISAWCQRQAVTSASSVTNVGDLLTLSVGGCLLTISNIHSNTVDVDRSWRWAMTAAIALETRQLDRAEQLERLRRQMAAVSGKVGAGRHVAERTDEVLPPSESL